MLSSMGAWHARPDQAELLPDALLVICAVPVVAGTPGSTHMHSMVVGIICSLPATPCGQYFGGPKGVTKHKHTHTNRSHVQVPLHTQSECSQISQFSAFRHCMYTMHAKPHRKPRSPMPPSTLHRMHVLQCLRPIAHSICTSRLPV